MVNIDNVFSVVALFIVFRETVEACIIVSVLLQFLSRSYPQLKKQVWWGVAAGVGLSILFGVIFSVVYYVAKSQLFQGSSKMIFRGVISWVAAILITILAFAMLRFLGWEDKWERRMKEAAIKRGEATTAEEKPVVRLRDKYNIFFIVFTTVLREGIESVVFLAGVGNAKPQSIPLPGFVGLVAGIAVGVFLFYGGKQVKDLKVFFVGMTVVILFLAAGQVSIGTDNLMQAGMFGKYPYWADELKTHQRPVWDISKCCSDIDKDNKFFALSRAIFGYQDKPTPMEILFYLGYWVLIAAITVFKYKRGTLFDADYKHKREQAKLREKAELEGNDMQLAAFTDPQFECEGQVQVLGPDGLPIKQGKEVDPAQLKVVIVGDGLAMQQQLGGLPHRTSDSEGSSSNTSADVHKA